MNLLGQGQSRLAEALQLSAGDARFEARLLMAHALGVNRAWLMAHGDESISADATARYTHFLTRRLTGEPIAYIFGEKEFYGLAFKVSSDVLIPRPETELLVDLALSRIAAHTRCRILDLGTGSGAIAIALARQRTLAELTAVDISPAALALARRNARRLGVAGQLRFMESDWFSALGATEKFDMIISNPPYIAVNDPHMACGDLRFEPACALAAENDGRGALTRIIGNASAYLVPGGSLLVEHGCDQGEYVRAALRDAGFRECATHRDLAGLERTSAGMLD